MTARAGNGYRLGPVEQIPLGEGRAFALADGSCATGDYAIRTYPVWEEDGQIVVVSHADG